MRPDEIKQAWEKYLHGQLPEREQKTLVQAMRKNKKLRNELLDDLEIHSVMKQLGTGAREFMNGFRERLDSDEYEMSERVARALKSDAPETVSRKSQRRRISFPLPLAAAAAFMVAVGVFVTLQRKTEQPTTPATVASKAQIVEVHGVAYRLPVAVGAKEKVVPGMILAAGHKLKTEKGGSLTIGWKGETTRVRVFEMSSVERRTSTTGGKKIYLEQGRLEANVARQPAGSPMLLETEHMEATVLGTSLELKTDAVETRLDVDEGIVEVHSFLSNAREEIRSRQTMVLNANRKKFLILGEVLLDEKFQNGAQNWTLRQEGKDIDQKPIVRDVDYNGSRRSCLVVPGSKHEGVNVYATHRKNLPLESLVCESEYILIGKSGKGNFTVGLLCHTGRDEAPLNQKTLYSNPVAPESQQWVRQRDEYLVTRNPRILTITGTSLVEEKERFKHRAIFEPDVQGFFKMTVRTLNQDVAVQRVTVRRLVKEVVPGKPLRDKPLAAYSFRDGHGQRIRDLSGTGEPCDFVIRNPEHAQWFKDGLHVHGKAAVGYRGPFRKLKEAWKSSQSFTLLVWARWSEEDIPEDDFKRKLFTFKMGRCKLDQDILLGNEKVRSWEPHLLAFVYRDTEKGFLTSYSIDLRERNTTLVPGNKLRLHKYSGTMDLALANVFPKDAQERIWSGDLLAVEIYGRALSPDEVRRCYLTGYRSRYKAERP